MKKKKNKSQSHKHFDVDGSVLFDSLDKCIIKFKNDNDKIEETKLNDSSHLFVSNSEI